MTKQTLLFGAGAALVLVVGLVLLARKGTAAVAALGQAVNPLSTENVFYRTAGAIANTVRGEAPGADASIGASIADWWGGLLKSDAEKQVDVMLARPLDSATGATDQRVQDATGLPGSISIAPYTSSLALRPTLYLGSKGAAVKLLQQKLAITADGIFGPQTQTAVKNFQRARGLVIDGIVGAATWAALG